MKCKLCEEKLLEYLYDELDESNRKEMERHLAESPACREILRSFQTVRDLASADQGEELPPGLHTRILAHAAEHKERRQGSWSWARLLRPAVATVAVAVLTTIVYFQTFPRIRQPGDFPRPVSSSARNEAPKPETPETLDAFHGDAHWDEEQNEEKGGQAADDTRRMSKERAAKQEAARRDTGNAEGPKTKQSARKGGKEGPAEESAVAAGRTLRAPAITRPGPHESGLKGAPGATGLEFDAESSAGEPLPESSKADVLSGDRFSAQVPQNMAEGELREKGRSGESGTEHGGVYQNRSGGASAGAGEDRIGESGRGSGSEMTVLAPPPAESRTDGKAGSLAAPPPAEKKSALLDPSGSMPAEKRPEETPSTDLTAQAEPEREVREPDAALKTQPSPEVAARAPRPLSEDAVRCDQEALSEAVKLAVTGRCQEASARLDACDEPNPDTRLLCRAWLEVARCFLGKHDLERARQLGVKAAGIPACADEAGSLLREIEKLPGTP